MRRFIVVFALLLAPAAQVSAQTLTTKDIVELTRAGLGEEVLVALIEVNRAVFPVDRETLKMLKDKGVRDNVIVAMIRSGRDVIPQPAPVSEVTETAPEPAPRPVVHIIEHVTREEPRYVREEPRYVPVAVPVYVPVHVYRPDRRPDPPRAEPVYWGFGGKLRPDAWMPDPPKVDRHKLDPDRKKN